MCFSETTVRYCIIEDLRYTYVHVITVMCSCSELTEHSCVYVYELVCSSQSVFPRVLSLQGYRPWLDDPAWSSYSSEEKEVE